MRMQDKVFGTPVGKRRALKWLGSREHFIVGRTASFKQTLIGTKRAKLKLLFT